MLVVTRVTPQTSRNAKMRLSPGLQGGLQGARCALEYAVAISIRCDADGRPCRPEERLQTEDTQEL